ncbi:MAG: DNA primase [Myxococcales bacterium]|nr:DNA primase [Myxococcales bacterium]
MISKETIEAVRDRTDIVALIADAVPSLKRRGRSFVGLCPFHQERTPSFHVSPERGFYHCFGCKESGSAVDFVMRHDGYDFPEAVRMLAERLGLEVVEEGGRGPSQAEAERHKKQREELYAASQLAAAYFEEQLRTHPHRDLALEELARRGVEPGKSTQIDDALQAFRMGYAPAGWDGLTAHFRQQGVSPALGEALGLLVPRSNASGHYDRFRNRLMFAVMDPQGRTVAFSGRALRAPPGDAEGGDPPPKYINSPESPIYTKGNMLFGLWQARHAIRQEQLAIVVEGNFDVVGLHARGVGNVVAPLGTAFTPDQARLLKRFADEAVLLFDGDNAGRKAVRLSREPLRAAGLRARVGALPTGTDPDDLVREKGPSAITNIVNVAKGMFEFQVDALLDETFSSSDAYEKAARVGAVVKLLAEEPNPLVRVMQKSYVDQLAGRLDMVGREPFQALERAVKDALAKQKSEDRRAAEERVRRHAELEQTTPRGDAQRVTAGKPGSAERQAIVGLLIEWPQLLDDPAVSEHLSLLEGIAVPVITALRNAWNAYDKKLDTDLFLQHVPAQVRTFASEHVVGGDVPSEEEARALLVENARRLQNQLLLQESSELARENYRGKGDWETEQLIAREAAEKARRRQGLS